METHLRRYTRGAAVMPLADGNESGYRAQYEGDGSEGRSQGQPADCAFVVVLRDIFRAAVTYGVVIVIDGGRI